MRKNRYEGRLRKTRTYKIYLNVNDLKRGQYELKIIYKNKVIKSTHFVKE